ncbi:hypothetical protein C8R47DRAFT_1082937 [Mycena vitilis]|nr:hypothetical protein C8R47DRAFT_1082937 [Mycena vitilis]
MHFSIFVSLAALSCLAHVAADLPVKNPNMVSPALTSEREISSIKVYWVLQGQDVRPGTRVRLLRQISILLQTQINVHGDHAKANVHVRQVGSNEGQGKVEGRQNPGKDQLIAAFVLALELNLVVGALRLHPLTVTLTFFFSSSHPVLVASSTSPMFPLRAISTRVSYSLRRIPTAVCAAPQNLGSLRSKGTKAGNGCFKLSLKPTAGGSTAHWAANCTQPSKCYRCGEEGHISTACTNTGPDLRGNIRCVALVLTAAKKTIVQKIVPSHKRGHISEKCTEPRDPERPFKREPVDYYRVQWIYYSRGYLQSTPQHRGVDRGFIILPG